ncbi:MAG: N-acetyl-gamma-glutamyl-phosphate reductase [Caulobacter sp.]|nr:N-acetyl-gamma-glutamyl-phosphate reductase [Caulobacter sp.]
MSPRIFIDGEAGTTGLQIQQRLAMRQDISLMSIDPLHRKDPAARADMLNQADLVILCLPDDAAREAVTLIRSPSVKIIDASSAHRTAAGWTYGFAEMDPDQRAAIVASRRVSNPGCYPTGAIALIRPLVSSGLLPSDYPVTINAVSGYTGGGKAMIAEFESSDGEAFRAYGLSLQHKHVPEMTVYAGLAQPPVFAPSVARFAQGMIVEIPLHLDRLSGGPGIRDIQAVLEQAYRNEAFVDVVPLSQTSKLDRLNPEVLNGTNHLRLHVFGPEGGRQARLVAVLDNLGKGASGAAVQNMNLMLGLAEGAGL